MTAFYEDSEHVVAWESIGKVRQGIAAIRSLYEDAYAEVRVESAALSSLDVRQSGDVAWATCRFKAETILRADGSRWTLDIRGSFVLKQEQDEWKIVLEHFSPIEGVPRVQRRE
jgi:ketosteroid isomerase-like protein